MVDSFFDQDHPAIEARLYGWRRWDGTAFLDPAPADQSATASGQDHGNSVITQALVDLTTGQDTGITDTTEQLQTSGQSWGSELFFWHMSDNTPAMSEPLDDAVTYGPDILNMSMSNSSVLCNNDNGINDSLNNLFLLANTFIVNTPGNNGQGSCTVSLPGAAAASFTPGALKKGVSDLNAGNIKSTSSEGGDAHGRALIDLVAPCGREGPHSVKYDDTYGTQACGTSFAAPLIAGAAANLKDLFIAHWGQGAANDVGNLYAHMLLMGDEQLQTGSKAGAVGNVDHDTIFGAGRLRMRLYTPGGMDAPWRAGFTTVVVEDGDQIDVDLNPINGINEPLPVDVDKLEIAVWWYEPNLASTETPAEIDIDVWREQSPGVWAVTPGGTMIASRRFLMGNPGGETYRLRITGTSIPASTDANYYDGLQKRKLHIAVMYEEVQRDDLTGPDCCDEIDLSYTECCAIAGSTCPGSCP